MGRGLESLGFCFALFLKKAAIVQGSKIDIVKGQKYDVSMTSELGRQKFGGMIKYICRRKRKGPRFYCLQYCI